MKNSASDAAGLVLVADQRVRCVGRADSREHHMTEEWEPAWVVARPGLLSIADELRDEFHERVFQILDETHGWGHSSRTIHPPGLGTRVHELIANTATGPHKTRLWVAGVEEGLFAWTAGTGELDASECSLWEGITSAALSLLGERTAVAWRAYLAQAPAALPYMRFRLAEAARLDGLELAPHPGVMTTDAMTVVGQVMAGPHVSSLIRVDGYTLCYAWHGDGETSTLRRLRLTSAIVSFAWDSPWYLRDGPTDRIEVTWADAPGPVSGNHYGWSTAAEGNRLEPLAVRLPSWVAKVASRLDEEAREDSPIYRAFLMHHEGLLVMREHPSLGLLTFVSTIETLAAMTEKLERCRTCNVVTGSTARFKRAIAQVLPHSDATLLAKAYNQRSRTVHDARLHGREHIAGGWGEMSLYRSDSTSLFESGVLPSAQKASRALLWRALDIDEPPTNPFDSVGVSDDALADPRE
jgi:hypothetical protein